MKAALRNMLVALASILVIPNATAQIFTNLHNFVFLDGTSPQADLILSGNTLYGTTHIYGGGDAGGYGSVFKLNIDGSGFTNLHTFSAIPPEGGYLPSALILSGNKLFGATGFGGTAGYGSIFSMDTNGNNLTYLYNFSQPSTDSHSNFTNSDGIYPEGGLVLSGNTFYGTANEGGLTGAGTIFSLHTDGTLFTNLHNLVFTNGGNPSRNLLLLGDTLYGTSSGGASFVDTIFKMNTNGTGYTNFYDFSRGDGPLSTNVDGRYPVCTLVLSGNTLYGTTSSGGLSGSGAVFAINTNGTGFHVLYYFSGMTAGTNSDGADPESGLTLSGNVLYGTASIGGSGGNGTLFKLNTDGTGFKTLYNFTATNNAAGTNADGAHPMGGLLLAGGALYGTASAGGTNAFGTVFRILVPPTLAITVMGTNAILSWPPDVTGFNLQSTTNLTAPNWAPVSGQYMITNPISTRQKYYRLMHP